MHPVFDLCFNQPFTLSDTLPHNFQGLQLQGGVVTAAWHPVIGTIILQEINGKQFNIVFSIFNVQQPCKLAAVQKSSLVVSFLAVRNTVRYNFKAMGQATLQQGQFTLLHCNAQEASMDFDKAGIYQTLEISWSKQMVEELLPSFALLRPLQEEKNLRRSFCLTPYSKTAGFRSLGMAHALMRFPHKDPNAVYLFEHKVKEYLLSLLIAAERIPSTNPPINSDDFNKIHLLYEQLRGHPERKFPISALAREANMSEKKLKKLFVQVFGMPIFEFHLETRMKEAHRLLEEANHNTKEIASMVGYQLTTSFITKFREFFGYPPSEVKRKY